MDLRKLDRMLFEPAPEVFSLATMSCTEPASSHDGGADTLAYRVQRALQIHQPLAREHGASEPHGIFMRRVHACFQFIEVAPVLAQPLPTGRAVGEHLLAQCAEAIEPRLKVRPGRVELREVGGRFIEAAAESVMRAAASSTWCREIELLSD